MLTVNYLSHAILSYCDFEGDEELIISKEGLQPSLFIHVYTMQVFFDWSQV